MKLTDYHAKYFAYELTKRCSSDSLEKLSSTLSNAQVDLNPHQIEAALFAFKSPLSKGAILADEVGLGKTIEAGLVLSQKWAERKRKILLIIPANLRKQWNTELQEKFFLPSIILETKSFNQYIKDGNLNPFDQEDKVIICSYHFARAKAPYIKQTPWDIIVIDEAHRLRNVYKTSNKIARDIKNSIKDVPKILLTATPLQNSLLELYGLVSIIDDHVFGDLKSFKANYARVSREQDIYESELGTVEPKQEMFKDLRARLQPICIRTLRKQVVEYINYTERKSHTEDYVSTEQETELYNGMSEYLQREKLYALPNSQRQLMTMILRKLLASSSFAIASTLNNLAYKLDKLIDEAKKTIETTIVDSDTAKIENNYEGFDEISDEWIDDEESDEELKEKNKKLFTKEDIGLMESEKKDLGHFRDLAQKIFTNSKGDALITALRKGFEMTHNLGAKKKAIIFTESTITQKYLFETLLPKHGYEGKIILFNGSNNDEKSKQIYKEWLDKNKDTDKISGSKSADTREAIIEYFRDNAEIMIATEAGAEGINLQFCSLVINYDLPWNPQRIEQRIGRCHRYGQKHDVVVVNFVNRKNAADKRVYELLDQKFKLFKGVFGASDEVLGSIESGVDFEKRIAQIYQTCRTEEEINLAFDTLQTEMDQSIQSNLSDSRQKLLENFDAEVHEKLRINKKESQMYLDTYERWLWDITQYYLRENADFSTTNYSFKLKINPFPGVSIDQGPYRIGKNIDDAHIYRPGHVLAQLILKNIKNKNLSQSELIFDYSGHGKIITPLIELVGKSGILKISILTIESFEAEDTIILSAFTNQNSLLDEDTIKKLLSLDAKVTNPVIQISKSVINKIEDEKIKTYKTTILNRNSLFFDEEVDKLDKWADDRRTSFKEDLRKNDEEIKILKKEARLANNLPEKLEMQKKIRDLNTKRDEEWKKYDESSKLVDQQKDSLLDRVEKRLNQKVTLNELFTIKWKVI